MKRTFIFSVTLLGLFLFSACDNTPLEPSILPEGTPVPMPVIGNENWSEAIMATIRTDVPNDAYYKDVFLDGGLYLTSRHILPACDSFSFSQEYFNGGSSKADSLRQMEVFAGDELDHNGILLYPDGEPRFRVFYSCGGDSRNHGRSLMAPGRNAVRSFNYAGGSYIGSCAGAFLAAAKRDGSYMPNYYGIWPGTTSGSGLTKSATGMFVDEGSPLLNYFDFGGDHYIDSVRHNGGCYNKDIYPGTEVLARYDKLGLKMHEHASIWAWKGSPYYGRVICCGSHPEEVLAGERMHLMAAMIYYAIDGRGIAKAKAILSNGQVYTADKDSRDNDPAHARIGDGQCHHYVAGIPKGAKNVRIRLQYTGDYDIRLLLKKDSFAFEEVADYKDVRAITTKELSFESLRSGTWYIGVYNATRAVVSDGANGLCEYPGQSELLNGIAYSVSIAWD